MFCLIQRQKKMLDTISVFQPWHVKCSNLYEEPKLHTLLYQNKTRMEDVRLVTILISEKFVTKDQHWY